MILDVLLFYVHFSNDSIVLQDVFVLVLNCYEQLWIKFGWAWVIQGCVLQKQNHITYVVYCLSCMIIY
jgi:hypothetical protein